MDVRPDEVAANLQLDEQGIWTAKTRASVSYPSDGNETCFSVEDSSFWFRHRNACIVRVVRAFPPAGPIFDIGGGNGFVAQGLSAAGWNTILVEPGAVGARNAKRRGLAHVVCSTLEDAEFRPHSLPAVGMFDVLEHLEDDTKALRELANLMIEGGRLYITVPAYRWLWSRDDESAGHFRRYTAGLLSTRLRESGFEVEFSSYIFAFLPPAILVQRTLPSMLGFERFFRGKDTVREHSAPSGPLQRLFSQVLSSELSVLEKRRSLPFGGSCLVVARSSR